MKFGQLFKRMKSINFSNGEARRLALHILEMPEEKQKLKISSIKKRNLNEGFDE